MLLNFFANLLLVSFLLSPHFGLVHPLASSDAGGPQKTASQSLGILTSASSVLVVDRTSQKVLYAKKADAVLPIASITKLMTVLVFLEHNPGWTENVLITAQDELNGGRIYIVPGDVISIQDLFNLTLIASSNEAASALARSTGLSGEEFVAAMNSKAQQLGMADTSYVEPSGLDPGNVSTAQDISKLYNHVFSLPEVIATNQINQYQFSAQGSQVTRTAEATNQLLDSFVNSEQYRVTGGKTGFIDESGYNLIMSVAQVNTSNEIIVVVLGSDTFDTRWQEAKGLVDWTFREYRWPSN